MFYLLKTESSVYSFADLEREKTTIWDGVTNPVAVRNLREMQKGAKLLIYHTGDEKRAVGTASSDLDRATALHKRARLLYMRGYRYGLRGLEVSYPGFGEKVNEPLLQYCPILLYFCAHARVAEWQTRWT